MSVAISLPPTAAPEFLQAFRERVSEDLQLLATLHDREPNPILIAELKAMGFPSCLTLLPTTEPATEAMTLMQHALLTLPDVPDQAVLDDLAADYASIYLNHNIGTSPEESVWVDEDSLMCQLSMFQVRSWYESFGLGIPDWRQRPDDHLVYELQFIAWMLNQDDEIGTLEQIAIFMDEHLLRWLGNFGERVAARCDTPYFAGVCALTAAYGEELREILAELLQQPRPSMDEVDKRMKPRLQSEEVPVTFTPGVGPVV